ncbi:AbfB domain-containing protein [Burkholderia gladioli]|uniref:AbfB domain-containing protein n=1 Tax=Burkholderia gladioli TaxID=28095 RepID=UPI001ABA15FE|nr:AbfB domain-containing protein [Burkholderia gladioli]
MPIFSRFHRPLVAPRLASGLSLLAALAALAAAFASGDALADAVNTLSLPAGAYQSFQVTTPGFTDRVARHQNGLGYTSVINASSAGGDRDDASFKVEPGRADASCYSFESRNFPGQFLRQQNGRVRKDAPDGSALFDQDATWCAQAGLSGQGVSLQPLKFPGSYLRHQNGELRITSNTGGSFVQDASWAVQPPLADRACTIVDWADNHYYPLGTVVRYQGSLYLEKAVGSNNSDNTNPVQSTYYWTPTQCSGKAAGLPAHIVGTYWAGWADPQPRIVDVDSRYNLIYLFAATPVGGQPGTTGAVQWPAPANAAAAANLVGDIQAVRAQGRKVILSIGGAQQNVSFDNRARSQAFIDSIARIYTQLGGFDGIDWDNYEASDTPNVTEMTWIGQQLKARYPGFVISSAPAPWSQVDLAFCSALLAGGALDYCAPQYYDGPNLADPAYVRDNVVQWMNALGPSHVVVGFSVNPGQTNFMTIGQAVQAWNAVKSAYPGTLGVFDWRTDWDAAQGWVFGQQMKPLVNP